MDPTRRTKVEALCGAKWFELTRRTPNGAVALLRLTFDTEAGKAPTPASTPAARRRAIVGSMTVKPNGPVPAGV